MPASWAQRAPWRAEYQGKKGGRQPEPQQRENSVTKPEKARTAGHRWPAVPL